MTGWTGSSRKQLFASETVSGTVVVLPVVVVAFAVGTESPETGSLVLSGGSSSRFSGRSRRGWTLHRRRDDVVVVVLRSRLAQGVAPVCVTLDATSAEGLRRRRTFRALRHDQARKRSLRRSLM